MPTQINHPDYYNANGYEAIEYIEAFNLNFNLGNVIKYVTRAGKKDADAVSDLQKAKWYLDRELNWRSNQPAPEDYLIPLSKPEITQ